MTYTAVAAERVASREIGYREHGQNGTKFNDWNGRIPGYPRGGFGYPWCATFQSWVADRAGGRANVDYPKTAGCAVAVGWFKSRGRWSSRPHVGDWVFYGPGGSTHVEMVVRVTGSHITTIGGNTSGSLDGRYFNGDGVYRKTVSRSSGRIYGYGRPLYGDAEPYEWGGGAPDGSPILRDGAIGPDVRDLQNALMAVGYDLPQYGADGEFGDETERAVRDFQRDHDLTVDGEYGPNTAWELREALAARDDDPDEQDQDEQEDEDMGKFYYGELMPGPGAVTAVSVYAGAVTWAGFLAGKGETPARLRVSAHFTDGTWGEGHEVVATPDGKKETVKLAEPDRSVDGFSVVRLDNGETAVGWDAT